MFKKIKTLHPKNDLKEMMKRFLYISYILYSAENCFSANKEFVVLNRQQLQTSIYQFTIE